MWPITRNRIFNLYLQFQSKQKVGFRLFKYWISNLAQAGFILKNPYLSAFIKLFTTVTP